MKFYSRFEIKKSINANDIFDIYFVIYGLQ